MAIIFASCPRKLKGLFAHSWIFLKTSIPFIYFGSDLDQCQGRGHLCLNQFASHPFCYLFHMEKMGLTRLYSPLLLEPDKELTSRVATSCLIGKIILDLPLYKHDVKCHASMVWKCKDDFSVLEINQNMFMFSFQDKQDSVKVLLNAPWTIKGGLLVLSPWACGKIPRELKFFLSPFWVQVHGLPVNYLTKENGAKIGQVLGEFICLDENLFYGEKFLSREFLRIRVVLDIRRPLLTGHWVKRTGLSNIWIEFRYEKLGVFCYKCGRIGNRYRSCQFPEVKAKFGPWLSVPPCVDALVAASSFGRGGAEVVVEREANPCTTLIKVPRLQTMLIQPSSLIQEIYDEKMESDKICFGTENLSTRNLKQRLIVNGLDSLGMMTNSVIIYARVAAAKAYGSNWRLALVMVAYFSYLVQKLVRVTRKSWLFRASEGQAPAPDHNILMVLIDLFTLISFFLMLKFF